MENINGREDAMYADLFHRKDRGRNKWKNEACAIFTSGNVVNYHLMV